MDLYNNHDITTLINTRYGLVNKTSKPMARYQLLENHNNIIGGASPPPPPKMPGKSLRQQ